MQNNRISHRKQDHEEPLLDLMEKIIFHREVLDFEPDPGWDLGLVSFRTEVSVEEEGTG